MRDQLRSRVFLVKVLEKGREVNSLLCVSIDEIPERLITIDVDIGITPLMSDGGGIPLVVWLELSKRSHCSNSTNAASCARISGSDVLPDEELSGISNPGPRLGFVPLERLVLDILPWLCSVFVSA
jgi:hypothetical protein